MPSREGSILGQLKKISISSLDPVVDPRLFPNPNRVAEYKQVLSKRDGYPIDEILAEIWGQDQEARAIQLPFGFPALQDMQEVFSEDEVEAMLWSD